jgi:microcystin degradation protein MlrC
VRFAIAEFKQEANTFVPRPTTLDDFRTWHLWTGTELIDASRGTNSELAGFIEVLERAGAEIVPIVGTFAMSGGKVTDDAYAAILRMLLDGLAAAGPIDGVLLALHGAMVTESDDDPDGETIERVRAAIGATPLVVTLDLHANVTERSVRACDALVGFWTSPHIDQADTGRRGAELMLRIVRGDLKPTSAFVKIPMVVPASTHMHHLAGPFKRLIDTAKAMEATEAAGATVFAVQPWLDVAEMGFAAVVVTDDDPALATDLACRLARAAWNERDAFMRIELVPVEEAIQRALAAPEGPIVLSDCADGTGAGSPGDATAVIAALLAADPPVPAYVCVRDAEAAAEAARLGVGARFDGFVGGKLDSVYNAPVRLDGEIVFAAPARYRFEGEGYTGVEMDMGPTAVVRRGSVSALIVSNAVMTVDPALYRSVGLVPEDARIIVVKSHIQFRAGYGPIAKGIMLLDSPGMSSDHIELLDFRRVPRPLFPLDRETVFACDPGAAAGRPAA